MLQKIKTALTQYIEPYLGVDLFEAHVVKDIDLEDQNLVKVHLVFGFPIEQYQHEIKAHLDAFLDENLHLTDAGWKVQWEITAQIQPHAIKAGLKRLKNIKNVIAVASGKGGVGKSTVALNVALALQKEGAKVGLLDADIYGPSQACLLGVTQPTPSKDGKHFEPTESYGLQTISMAYMIPQEETPMVWRGPMVGRALEQLFFDTHWPELDYLVIDLPPGTGDVSLTMIQKIPVTGVIMVTTPQKVAVLDVRKALTMFAKVNVPVIGIVENMAAHVCPSCGHTAPIFGEKGGEALAKQYDVPLLGRLVLDPMMCDTSESGVPWMTHQEVHYQQHVNTQTFYDIARGTAAKISLTKIDYTGKFPGVVVEKS